MVVVQFGRRGISLSMIALSNTCVYLTFNPRAKGAILIKPLPAHSSLSNPDAYNGHKYTARLRRSCRGDSLNCILLRLVLLISFFAAFAGTKHSCAGDSL